jgi:hypothetical protein
MGIRAVTGKWQGDGAKLEECHWDDDRAGRGRGEGDALGALRRGASLPSEVDRAALGVRLRPAQLLHVGEGGPALPPAPAAATSERM